MRSNMAMKPLRKRGFSEKEVAGVMDISVQRKFMGARAREIRRKRGLTQLDVARQVGVTDGQISTIERGVSSPSIETLCSLAKVLETPLYEFFVESEEKRIGVVRGTQRKLKKLGTGTQAYEIPSPRVHRSNLVAYHVIIDSQGGSSEKGLNTPAPCLGFLMSGKVDVTVGVNSYSMKENDSIWVPPHVSIHWKNTAKSKAEGLVVVIGD
ncbi:MAG: XRE family transcriptional regulator [Candidatus Eisenbacteria bacterium]|nr:XRE family transcriptional regulator [Candidatus Eisenbacteria bacterium]